MIPTCLSAGTVTVNHTIGDTPVSFQITQWGEGETLVALHENETTSIVAAKVVLAQKGGTLVELRHGGTRNLKFSFRGISYTIDPNRIFTDNGIRQNLHGRYSREAHEAVGRLAKATTALLDRRWVIALHNNTNNRYSVTSYVREKEFSSNAAAVATNDDEDIDDFFYVTERRTYDRLAKAGFNVVLQSATPVDDGSLSIWCAQQRVPYVNVEAQIGHKEKQVAMLEALLDRN